MESARPSSAEVDDAFLSLMDELMIPEAQRHAMLVMDDAKKWKMVEESRLGQAATRADGRSFADGLRVGGDRAVERVVELARVLRTCDRRFLDEFIRHDGVKQLFSLQMNWDPVRKARHCHDFVECCRGVMNTGQAGLDAVMATPFAVRCLASYLAPQQAHISGSTALLGTQHRAHVLELLAAVCVMEDTAGYSLVLDALDNIRLAHAQPSRFTCVLAALGEAGPTETALQTSALTFINALISFPEELLARLWVRAEFVQHGLIAEVEKLERVGSGNEDLATQLGVFRKIQAEDEKERAAATDKTAAGDDLEELWELLDTYLCSEHSEVRPFFVNMLQSLLMIPHGDPELSARMWRFAAAATTKTLELGDVDRAASEQYFRDLMGAFGGEQLLVVAAQKHEESGADDALAADLVAVVEKLNLNPAAKRVDEYAKLKARAESLRSAATSPAAEAPKGTAGGGLKGADGGPSLDAHIASLSKGYDAQLQSLKDQIQAQRTGKSGAPPAPTPPPPPRLVDSSVVAPPPPAQAPAPSTPAPPPPARTAPPPPSGAPAPPAPPAPPGAPPPPPGRGPPGGPPPPPGRGPPPAGGGPPPPPKPVLPPKPKQKPRKPMKTLNWQKMPDHKAAKTMFGSLSEDSVKLDIDALEAAFCANPPAARAGGGGATKKEEAAKTYLDDQKRANNIGIMISRLKMTEAEVCHAIEECDEEALSEEILTILRACVPTPEEQEAIHAFKEDHPADVSKVGKPERFQMEVGGVKHVRERIDILCWLHEYNEKMSGLEPDVEHVTAALTELNTAKSFAELLALVLAVGNYMNGGSFRGGAAGFKLDALNKLADVRSTTQPGKTLLDFMVKFICQHHQGVAAKLVSELGNVGSAAKVAYSNISTELNSLKGSVRATLSKLDKVKDVAGKLHDRLEGKVKEYDATITALGKRVADMEKLRLEVLLRFGEDPKSGEIGEVFQCVLDFLSSFSAAQQSFEAGGAAAAAAGGGKGEAEDQSSRAVDNKLSAMKKGTFRRRAGSSVGNH